MKGRNIPAKDPLARIPSSLAEQLPKLMSAHVGVRQERNWHHSLYLNKGNDLRRHIAKECAKQHAAEFKAHIEKHGREGDHEDLNQRLVIAAAVQPS